ncbi:MAG: Galactose-1-phosphate uridylyltransferase [Candidatus Nomurabacteria bacterium GW2011_GWA1_46_11]|uniref:Galactose-1-phosphate uridyl transferase N-terminal domain-containing protein n=2 Tax=Parcubacteria group TaxID=1794811 RepID=A0A1F8EZ13_9BACT|nr:MAG: Galactose-1-phosphate uridylyltransferase [Candidatus Nomurabacteria bacterium GW2011_GWA1_46_11]OGN06093.1 MAG: hypothetical protein A2669_01015 [Candidatus Yanofskybacteria bacterium RIFCSPHIGHO2_01_FULL_48_25b]
MLNEFRRDPISGDWILFSTNRAAGHISKGNGQSHQPKEDCPFEPEKIIQNTGQTILALKNGQVTDSTDNWTTIVVPNKYPALAPGLCPPPEVDGPFQKMLAHGFHELVITRDHERSFPDFSKEETVEIIKAYHLRYNEIAKDDCGDYILILHNHGRTAGSTIYHNHSQILSMPVIPPVATRSLAASKSYWQEKGQKIFSILLDREVSDKKRVIFENGKFVAFCPYVSKAPFEIKIFPKMDQANFGSLAENDFGDLAEALNASLGMLSRATDDIDYNFFIHTSPLRDGEDHYRWHVEIVPRVSPIAGLELGAGVFLNVVDPDDAAERLRNAK